MRVMKSILRIEFAEATHPWLEFRELLRVAGGDVKAELQAAPVTVDQAKKRQRVILQVKATIAEFDIPESAEEGAKAACQVMNELSSASEFPKIVGIRHESIFIEPYSLPFHELTALMKEKFLAPNRLTEDATDIGLTFDQRERDLLKHMELGPMEADQLQSQYLRFPVEDVPDTFFFVGLAYADNTERSFSVDSLQKILDEATAWQVEEAETILGMIK